MPDDQPQKTDRQRWLGEVQALVNRCVPNADPVRAHLAAHQIVEQLESVWRGTQKVDFTKWRGAFEPWSEEEVW